MAWMRRAANAMLILLFLFTLGTGETGAESIADIDALNRQVVRLLNRGKYVEAAPIAQRARILAERKLGREHPDTLASVSNLAWLYRAQGRYAEAEPLYRRALKASERVLGGEHFSTIAHVNNLATLYQAQGRYAEAETLYRRALEVAEQVMGREHVNTLTSVNNLALQLKIQGRYTEAEPLYRRALAAQERVLGREHPQTLVNVNDLAALYQAQGRYAEAEPLYRRALEASERVLGREHPDALSRISRLATLYQDQGRYAEAEPLYRRALEASERVLGREHPDALSRISRLATLYQAQGRYAEAEPLHRRALEASERVLGREHPQTLTSISRLATLYQAQGRYAEAEPLHRRALEASERVLGREHPYTLSSFNQLAMLYMSQEQYTEAEPLYRHALEASERVLGRDHPTTFAIVNNLAALYQAQGRHVEAEPLYRRALEASERVLGREHPDTLASIGNLAWLYQTLDRYTEAEPLCRRTLEAKERVLGREHPDTLISVNNLANLYQDQGRHVEAEPLYRRALAAQERVLGREHPGTLASVSNLAWLYFKQDDWARATQFWRRSTATLAKRMQHDLRVANVTSKRKSIAKQQDFQFSGIAKAVYRLAPEGYRSDAVGAREIFQTIQWAHSSEAEQSLAQMAARGASGRGALAVLVRGRQDLFMEWQRLNAMRDAALGRDSARRDAREEAKNYTRMITIEALISETDGRLSTEFPEYAALANPVPLAVEEVQALLGADEVLVLFLVTEKMKPTPEETFIWVVSKTDIRWVRSDLGTEALTREVQALRCGLDAEAWESPRCAELTGKTYTDADRNAGKPLPFDHSRAHTLYKALFGQVEDMLKGKHLLIVPSGPLTLLPFQALVTAAPPSNGDHRSAAWLIRDHALTILPAVSSLKALRRVARPSTATKPMIGFGNPLLDGQQNHANPNLAASFKKHAQRAREKQQCQTTLSKPVAELLGWRRGVSPVATRGGLAEIDHIRRQTPLPETADELCAVARDLKVNNADIHLGKSASEHEVKSLSASGKLAQYRIVHFATHGALAGELKGTSEPGLILTPPRTATEDDDGYLSASEIAALKLDADWVILSACNTAAGDTTNAQALSGLARAFIYAQARALLVSHWAVDSNATVRLITVALRETARDTKVGRAEALRRSMLALIDKGDAKEAHPAFWAPFIVVGEGAR